MGTSIRIRGRSSERIAIAAVLALIVLYAIFGRVDVLRSVNNYTHPHISHFSWSTTNRHIELSDEITWSNFAYSTYATAPEHLCNALMIFSSLQYAGARADRLLLYSDEWDLTNTTSPESVLLRLARVNYDVKLQPISIWRMNDADPTWAAGFTKLLAFNQTQYQRILNVDSDGTVLRSMDELFLMPAAPVAMPRAYWLNDTLTDGLTLVQPSTAAFVAIQKAIHQRKSNDYDMEIVNAVYGSSCAVIPHRPYHLITGEFRAEDHTAYQGSADESWDPEAIIREAKYVHFSDWPLPKPWLPHSEALEREVWPKYGRGGLVEECAERRIWKELYEDFRRRRGEVCGEAFVDWKLEEAQMAATIRTETG